MPTGASESQAGHKHTWRSTDRERHEFARKWAGNILALANDRSISTATEERRLAIERKPADIGGTTGVSVRRLPLWNAGGGKDNC
jgi:hypothetical protein